MHSTIYQLGTSPISEYNYITPDHITEGDTVGFDYAKEVAHGERKTQLEKLLEILPKGMLTLNHDLSITYNGGIDEWRLSYAGLIKEKAEAITPDKAMTWTGPVYNLQMAVFNPLDTNCLFITDYGTGYGVAERSIEFMRLINLLNPGDRLYAGLIADYYF